LKAYKESTFKSFIRALYHKSPRLANEYLEDLNEEERARGIGYIKSSDKKGGNHEKNTELLVDGKNQFTVKEIKIKLKQLKNTSLEQRLLLEAQLLSNWALQDSLGLIEFLGSYESKMSLYVFDRIAYSKLAHDNPAIIKFKWKEMMSPYDEIDIEILRIWVDMNLEALFEWVDSLPDENKQIFSACISAVMIQYGKFDLKDLDKLGDHEVDMTLRILSQRWAKYESWNKIEKLVSEIPVEYQKQALLYVFTIHDKNKYYK